MASQSHLMPLEQGGLEDSSKLVAWLCPAAPNANTASSLVSFAAFNASFCIYPLEILDA